MSSVNPDVVTAFFAGCTAVTTSGLSIWLTRRNGKKDCEEKLEAFRKGLHEMEPDDE